MNIPITFVYVLILTNHNGNMYDFSQFMNVLVRDETNTKLSQD